MRLQGLDRYDLQGARSQVRAQSTVGVCRCAYAAAEIPKASASMKRIASSQMAEFILISIEQN
jgi:hypothetical protein